MKDEIVWWEDREWIKRGEVLIPYAFVIISTAKREFKQAWREARLLRTRLAIDLLKPEYIQADKIYAEAACSAVMWRDFRRPYSLLETMLIEKRCREVKHWKWTNTGTLFHAIEDCHDL